MSSEKGMEFSLARKSAFITVSESTRQDLLTEYPEIDPEDVFTVYEASDPKVFYHVTDQAQLKQVRQKYHIPEKPYLLALNTIEPRKNLTNTIRAFLLLIKEQPELDLSFVVAGKKGWKCQELFKEPLLQSERIVFTGFIAEEDLAALYSGALALSYVSYYEGFGLPLLEAMSCGTPVIYGNNSSMPEVVGDGGLPADPNDIEDIKEQFKRIVTDEDFRKMLAQRASHQAKKFSWEKTIKGTLEAYEKMIMNP